MTNAIAEWTRNLLSFVARRGNHATLLGASQTATGAPRPSCSEQIKLTSVRLIESPLVAQAGIFLLKALTLEEQDSHQRIDTFII